MGNPNIKLVQDLSQNKPAPAPQKVVQKPPPPQIDISKRHLKDMKKDYEKCKKEFMEKSTQQIRELLKKLGQNVNEEEKIKINDAIDLIKKIGRAHV